MSEAHEQPYPPLASYGLIGDCHSCGLVSRSGSVDWACFRRFDGPSAFGRILDWGRGGYCHLAPLGSEPAGRRYLDEHTLILESDHRVEGGLGRTTDFFAVSSTSHPEQAERVHPYHQLIRIAEAASGSAEWEFVCRPRFEYGIGCPRASLRGERVALIVGGPEALSVSSSVPLEAAEGEVRARFRLGTGERAWFALTWSPAEDARIVALDDEEVTHRLAYTCGFWREWAGLCAYRGPYRSHVLRSAVTLKALTNAPTGAIVAAPTTSLPEALGGVRNWDYRFCWLRDSAFTLYALDLLGYRSEAHAFVEWLERTTAGRAEDLQVLYGVGGERLLPETTLDHLEGYRGSRPVRIGNGATGQFQLDIYGEVLDTAHLCARTNKSIGEEFWSFLRDCVRCIGTRWRDPDDGIWEVRGGPRHFVHSKVLSWVGVDRAIKMATGLGLQAPVDDWRALREQIRRDVLDNGFNAEVGAFVQSYGSTDLDASALLLPLLHFVRPEDPRMRSTVDAIQRHLTVDGLVYRYLSGDGLPGGEATFTVCSFWLVNNLVLQGRVAEGRRLFERLCSLGSDLGLFAEELDPASGEQLGNFPQAYTHVALINSALHLARAGDVASAEPT